VIVPTQNHASVTLETVAGPAQRFALRFPSGAVVATEPSSTDEVANPVDLVLGALGACAAMDVIGILRKKRQVVLGYEVAVRGERREEAPRIYTRIEVVHRLRGRDLSPAAIEEAIRLSDTKYCSVHGMLEGAAEIQSRYEILPP
jgi:putative redox protein